MRGISRRIGRRGGQRLTLNLANRQVDAVDTAAVGDCRHAGAARKRDGNRASRFGDAR